jgi:phenylacetate-CoA ligase
VLATLPSQLLRIGRTMQAMGEDPRKSSITRLFTGGEPAGGIDATRERLEDMWDAELVEFYGCTEASPHSGGYSCTHRIRDDGAWQTHLMEDFQVWELIDPDTKARLPVGERGITVCTNMNSESSSQLRFVVGDYTTLDDTQCACGRTHVRAIGGFQGRADDLINLRGIKFYPSVIEEGVRSVTGVGDEYQVILETNKDGIDTMTIKVEHAEHANPDSVVAAVQNAVTSRIEVRVDVDVLAPDTFEKTEFKAKRITDTRDKS